METTGVHHVGLTVSSLEETASFFINCLGWSLAHEVPEYPAKFVTNGSSFFTLWQTDKGATPFDRRSNVGLHQVAIMIKRKLTLNRCMKR